MPAAMIALSPDLERLIDERLDAVDRILSLSRTARSERMQILSDLESQIRDRLASRTSEEPTRADLLAVLAELDPPEAYLDESVSISPAFRASGFANEGSQRVAGDTLAASIPATKSENGTLALWAGFLVSAGCILMPSITFHWNLESFFSLRIVLPLTIVCGSFLAFLNLLQTGPKSDINRLITWACVGTFPFAAFYAIVLLAVLLGGFGSDISEEAVIVYWYAIPAFVPLTHGIWLGFFTVRYMWKRQAA
ncbi:MAG: hypothetical protein U0929_09870 [Planctomycetaceae bacterium]